jgi:hypothetical protein
MSAEGSLSVGEKIQVEWNGSWYPAEVVSITSDNAIRIHYDGYDSSSDETVTMARIRRGAAAAAAAAAGIVEHAPPPPGPICAGGIEGFLQGETVTDKTRLHPGDRLNIEWNGSWWAGEVVAANSDGTVRIHYAGWDSNYDETVGRSRLQLPGTTPRLVTVVFAPNWKLTGTIVKVLPDGLVVSRAEDHKLCVVSRATMAYFEINQ